MTIQRARAISAPTESEVRKQCKKSKLFDLNAKPGSIAEIFERMNRDMVESESESATFSKTPIPLTGFHSFVSLETDTPLPSETPRPLNARRLQPPIKGAWGIGNPTPLPMARGFIEPAERRGDVPYTNFRFPDSEAFSWSNLADLFDDSGTLRPTSQPRRIASIAPIFAPALQTGVYDLVNRGEWPTKLPNALEWVEPLAKSNVSTLPGGSAKAASSLNFSNLVDLFKI
jgi:hypothetical protein